MTHFSQLFLLFIIYSFLGWIGEVIHALIKEKKWVNRGFLYGPLCPIYGFGGLAIYIFLSPFNNSYVLLFITSALLTTTIEYIGSFLLEKLFNTKWWDYSDQPFNLHGRVCLAYGLLFGLAGTLVVHFVQPFVVNAIMALSEKTLSLLSKIICIVFVTDLFFTIKSLLNFQAYLVKLKEFRESLQIHLKNEEWFTTKSIENLIEEIKDRYSDKKEHFVQYIIEKIDSFKIQHQQQKRFFDKFPTMTSKVYDKQLQEIKLSIKNKLKKIIKKK